LVAQAVQGAGVDRHLLGLKLLASENGLDLPSLYTDPSYKRSNYHRISSSQVSGKYEAFVCFGPLVMDGYGICYNIRDQDLIIGLSNMKSCKDTSVDAFNEALDKSLIEMHDLCVSLNQKAKL
jgi:carnitine O-acetyltransferase